MDPRFEKYLLEVSQNKILTGRYTKLSIRRHIEDMKQGEDFPYYFDDKKANKIIRFVEAMKHYEGKWAGTPIVLEPWQVFILASVYGWRRKEDGTRRFRKAFVFVGRKNGKTLLASALQLFELLTEPGAQVYSIATQRKQAEVAFNNCKQFVKQNADLAGMIDAYRNTLVYEKTASKIEALSSEYNKFDGLNPQFVLADEVSAHPNSRLIDVMQSGMYSRVQPLLFMITTANHSLENPGRWEWERSRKILERKFEDETYFCILYELDDKDEWTDSKNFIKANPNLGVTIDPANLETALAEAIQQPSKQTEFKCKNLNLWLNSAVTEGWITAESWEKCQQPRPKDLSGFLCVGAIDLSKRNDWTAYSKYFMDQENMKFYTEHLFFIPEGQIEIKMRHDSELVRYWIDSGLVIATPGDTVDYEYLKERIRKDIQSLPLLKEIAFDRWSASDIINEFKDLTTLTEMAMDAKNFSEPAKRWEEAILKGQIVDTNPVMSWQVSCVSIYQDFNGNIKPIKPDARKSTKRIDGVITSIMAYTRLLSSIAEKRRPKASPGSIRY